MEVGGDGGRQILPFWLVFLSYLICSFWLSFLNPKFPCLERSLTLCSQFLDNCEGVWIPGEGGIKLGRDRERRSEFFCSSGEEKGCARGHDSSKVSSGLG
jgi:hypothetical protein